MKQKYATLIVNDIKQSTEFYMSTFNLIKIEEYDEKDQFSMVMLTDEENVIELIENNEEAKISSIGFEVDNLNKIIEKLENQKIEFIRKPKNEHDFQFAIFYDPNGLMVSITEKQ